MSKALLQKAITNGVDGNLNDFFLSVSNFYTEKDDDLADHDDERFASLKGIGEINFEDGQRLVVVTVDTTLDLTERSGKRDQYEKAKRILKSYTRYDAGVFVFSDANGNFRLSLVYGTPDATRTVWSNFRRFTYYASPSLTNKTFLDRVGNCDFTSLAVVKDAFSVEKVNKEFYSHIAKFFYRLTGYQCKREMTLPSVSDDDKETYQEFAVRLIGRTIFCWFLKHKKSEDGASLVPESVLSSESVKQNSQYYHSTLEKLFFEVLNTPQDQRHTDIIPDTDKIPFLNGGLFEPHDDFYDSGKSQYNLMIPDIWFEQFFEILEQYNFTIDENSSVDTDVCVDPEMLGRIFENLLAEVNPVTGETARKATGSYYTPRTIVDYMVEQSLTQYLLIKTGIDKDKITNLLSFEVEDVSLTEREKDSIVSALDEIRVIDPACGSGAFPMGVLHKMLLVLQKVDPDLSIWLRNHFSVVEPGILRDKLMERIRNENWEYVRKLLIIQKSIYGVDIQTIAVEISKLRFFLSLIVDEQIDDLKTNRGVEALPNLEFKFVAANSLIGVPPVMNRQVGLGIVNKEIIRLKELRNKYLRSYGLGKKQIEEDFLKTQGKLIEQAIEWGGKDALALQLANWNPFSNKASKWFDPRWMFGEDCFDIVLANPPYLGEKGHKDIFGQIKQGTLREYYQGKMDMFYFFFHLSIDLGNETSQIAFITTNYYPTATGAGKLRRDFKNRMIVRKLVNFNELRIFESALGQHNMLTILSKGHDDKAMAETCITKRKGNARPETLQSIVEWRDCQTDYYQVSQRDLYEGDECYIRLAGTSIDSSDPTGKTLAKIMTQGTCLQELCHINAGADVTISKITKKHTEHFDGQFECGDGVFVISDREMSRLGLSSTEFEITKPFIKNSDISKYSVNPSGDKLIYLRWEDDVDRYPNIKRHLLLFKEILEDQAARYGENYPWFALHRPRDPRVFEAPEKILVPYRCKSNVLGYSTEPLYSSRDVLFITKKNPSLDLRYALALLNSRLYYLWLYSKGKRKGETLELVWQPLSEIPIKKISEPEQQPFVVAVGKILAITKDEDYFTSAAKQAKVKELERQIDQMVYELYGLTPDEIAVVEGRLGKDDEAGIIINALEIGTTEDVDIDDQEENAEEVAQVEIILIKDKETPGTWRYKEQKEDHPLTIYLTNEQVKALGNPESIKITVTAA